jgi:hypothetical protein
VSELQKGGLKFFGGFNGLPDRSLYKVSAGNPMPAIAGQHFVDIFGSVSRTMMPWNGGGVGALIGLPGGSDATIGNATPPSLRTPQRASFRCLWPVSVGSRSFSIDVYYLLDQSENIPGDGIGDGDVLPDPAVTSLRGIELEDGSGELIKESSVDQIIQEPIPLDEDGPRVRIAANPFCGVWEDVIESIVFGNDGVWQTVTASVEVLYKGVLEVFLENPNTNLSLRVNWDNIQVA